MKTDFRKELGWLIVISLLVRTWLAWQLELGNDEVYYWTYALYPDWSHYDHPPMLGWVMQLFSLNLLFDSELALRLSSVLFFSLNTLLIFTAGKIIRDARTGWYAALLYNASVYASVITGVLILPDTPQNLFWMLSLVLLLKIFASEKADARLMLLFGLLAGLGMISKYTSVFLWSGVVLYILIYDRKWFTRPSLYGAMLISALCGLPVLIWNLQNDFISFAYQGSRVNIFESGLRPDLFFTELSGQVFYNNPVNWVLTIMALIALFRGKILLTKAHSRLLLLVALPPILLFLLFSLFRPTLPHWTGPAYNSLLLLTAAYLAGRPQKDVLVPVVLKVSLGIVVAIMLLGNLQINFGIIPLPDKNPYHRLGRHDLTLDMYGWKKTAEAFGPVRERIISEGNMQQTDAMVAENWFPLANLDYYVARPLGMKALGLGRPDRLHKYIWINEERGGLHAGDDYWYLTDSRNYKHPEDVYSGLFREVVASDTLTIMRANKPAKYVFVFLLKEYMPDQAE
jgi:4-amino-4-deoxy-L-arabinose transferase-like glycosyltransferase